MRSTDHKASHYVILSTPSLAQISSLPLYSRTPSAYVPPSVWVQASYPCNTTSIITVLCILISYFWMANRKIKNSALNDSLYSLTSIWSLFFHELNFDLIWLFPNIWTVPVFQRVYYSSLCYDSVLHAGLKTWPNAKFSWHLLLDKSPY